MPRKTALAVLLVPAVLALAARPAVRLHFDSDAAGAAPAFLQFEGSPGIKSFWRVNPYENPLSTPNVVTQAFRGDAPGKWRFALSTQAGTFRDGRVSVGTTRLTRTNPCRSGVVLRYRDPENFVAALYDFQVSDVIVLSRRRGESRELFRSHFESLERGWTTVGLSGKGKNLAVTVSGRDVSTGHDPDPERGRAGLVAETGCLQAFDELVISPE
jgi:hypothetical protein